MLTITTILLLAALILTLVSAATGRVPLWIGVLLVIIVELLHVLPR
jgi:hypothetical protein